MYDLKPNKILLLIGTSLFVGYIPFGPGTFTSVLAIPFVILLAQNSLVYILTTIVLTIIGIISAQHLGKVWQRKDDGRITIDEFVGIFVTFLLIKLNWYIILIGFILFRFFDIVKPLFIRHTEKVQGGFGVMFDDILSGIYANLFLRLLLFIIR